MTPDLAVRPAGPHPEFEEGVTILAVKPTLIPGRVVSVTGGPLRVQPGSVLAAQSRQPGLRKPPKPDAGSAGAPVEPPTRPRTPKDKAYAD